MKKILYIIPALLLIAGCTPRDGEPVPHTILHLDRAEVLSGDAAAEIINHLHQKSVVPEENYVGRYKGNDQTATYYLSIYANPDEAEAELHTMIESMERGGHVFDHIREINVNDHNIWMALGMGQAHYFYAEGNRLIWLAIDIEIAEEGIKSLL